MKWLKNLLGCERRARANLLRVYRWRIEHAETAEDLLRIADDAIADGVISEVAELMDAKPLPAHERIALNLYREWEIA